MLAVVCVAQARVLFADGFKVIHESGPGLIYQAWRVLPAAFVTATAVWRHAMRNGLLDCGTQRPQVVRQVFSAQRGLARRRSAADVHTHGGGDDGLDGRDHRPDGGADTQVHVRHGSDVLEDDRQTSRIAQLLTRFVFYRHALGPHLDGHRTFLLFNVVVHGVLTF